MRTVMFAISLLGCFSSILFVTGCSTGAQLHRPAEEKTAQVAKDALDASKITSGLKAERILLAELTQREADIIRRSELALRDRWLLSVFKGEDGLSSWTEINKEILQRVKFLLGPSANSQTAIKIGTDIERIRFLQERLDVQQRMYNLASQGKGSTTCPAPVQAPKHATQDAADFYADFLEACDGYTKVNKELEDDIKKVSGLFVAVTNELALLKSERNQVKVNLAAKKEAYNAARNEYEEAIAKGNESVIATKAKALQDKLKALGEKVDTIGATAQKLHFPQLGEEGYLEQLKIQSNSISQILDALQGAQSKAVPSANFKPALLVASTLTGFEKAFSAVKHPEVGPALIQSEHIRLELSALERRLSRIDERESLLKKRVDAILLELQYLAPSMTNLTVYVGDGCSKTAPISDAFKPAGDIKCRQSILNALVRYSVSWELARVEQELLHYRMRALEHEIVLDHSENPLAQNQNLVRIPLRSSWSTTPAGFARKIWPT
ncbi:hypothetical protein [Candidatus Nitrotoga sp. 1052]|uniref:hypothetical protein n=1 Tax=Candidatus Nitrotoga sp. 1052 TaxID=2886964 RepID=UPI001EF724A0|nr:hypothetical protein [Candidatus Nitrotoga sp. 1052]CAH1073224.1 exported hypothetical protein [Candidatus Nitrotoga sp. 1052]